MQRDIIFIWDLISWFNINLGERLIIFDSRCKECWTLFFLSTQESNMTRLLGTRFTSHFARPIRHNYFQFCFTSFTSLRQKWLLTCYPSCFRDTTTLLSHVLYHIAFNSDDLVISRLRLCNELSPRQACWWGYFCFIDVLCIQCCYFIPSC